MSGFDSCKLDCLSNHNGPLGKSVKNAPILAKSLVVAKPALYTPEGSSVLNLRSSGNPPSYPNLM